MNTKFAVCINNKGFEASLEVGKLYEIVADAEAESDLELLDVKTRRSGSVQVTYRVK